MIADFFVDARVLDFVRNWSKSTVLHRFVRWIADGMFLDDTGGPYVHEHVFDGGVATTLKRYLPVDIGLRAYGISDNAFEIPPPDGEYIKDERNITAWHESGKVADACDDYFVEGLRLSQDYEDLLAQIADEVFHIMFLNRGVMARLNELVAGEVQALDIDMLSEESQLAKLFTKEGRLRRTEIPKWVMRAVFFRDHGLCVSCGMDLSGLIDALAPKQFDHIVPLARGGLNDVTNLQLLCEPCNVRKSDSLIRPSNRYRRWYEREGR